MLPDTVGWTCPPGTPGVGTRLVSDAEQDENVNLTRFVGQVMAW